MSLAPLTAEAAPKNCIREPRLTSGQCSCYVLSVSAGRNKVTRERIKELVEIISDLQVESVQREDYESFLEIAMASRQLFRAVPGAEAPSRTALYSMENALGLLVPKVEKEAVDLSAIKCSFYGKQAPEVTHGANAFICNECVDLFTEIFRSEKEHNGSSNGVV
jgi:hypothetical protein